MKRPINTFFVISLILFCIGAANAQQSAQTDQQATPEDIANADVVILANIRARELKIEVVPKTKVDFPGNHERKTFWEDDRQNLPRPVEPGVTYRNIGIQLRIVSRFADIERIVAEALGEIPISDDALQPNQQTPTPQTNLQSVKKNEQTQPPQQLKKPSPKNLKQ